VIGQAIPRITGGGGIHSIQVTINKKMVWANLADGKWQTAEASHAL